MSRNSSSEDGHGAAAPENFSPNAFNPQQLSGPDLAHIAENTAQGLALIQGTLQAMLASLERANNDQEALSNTLDTGLRETLQAMLASLERANNDQEASSNTIDTGLREIAGGLDRVESELTGNSAQMNLLLARTEAQASDIGEQFRDVCAPFQEMFREEMERQQAARDALAASEVERRQRTWMIIISRFLASSWAATKREIVAVWNNVGGEMFSDVPCMQWMLSTNES